MTLRDVDKGLRILVAGRDLWVRALAEDVVTAYRKARRVDALGGEQGSSIADKAALEQDDVVMMYAATWPEYVKAVEESDYDMAVLDAKMLNIAGLGSRSEPSGEATVSELSTLRHWASEENKRASSASLVEQLQMARLAARIQRDIANRSSENAPGSPVSVANDVSRAKEGSRIETVIRGGFGLLAHVLIGAVVLLCKQQRHSNAGSDATLQHWVTYLQDKLDDYESSE